MQLRTAFGVVVLRVWRGKNPADGAWGIPMRQRWGLCAHQQLSPALEDKLAYFATVTGSYEAASRLAAKVGVVIEDSTVRALVQRLGARAHEQTQARLKTIPKEKAPTSAPSALAVVMIDGFQVRHRGEGWGEKKTRKPRVAWHEQKIGVFYRHEQNAAGQLTQKVVVSCQGEPVELGERLHWEARRGGLGRARETLSVCDGAAWIWNLVSARWGQAHQLLDFYHASQHLHALGEAWHPHEAQVRHTWVEKQLHDLRHGREKRVLRRIAGLVPSAGPAGEVIEREQNYFANHAGRMNYGSVAARGWPIGSGAVESACAQKQGRVKGPGQFWSPAGLRHLTALIETRDNGYWEELWLPA
jgi:hypothetical protein